VFGKAPNSIAHILIPSRVGDEYRGYPLEIAHSESPCLCFRPYGFVST
jgi:hypothetical protein